LKNHPIEGPPASPKLGKICDFNEILRAKNNIIGIIILKFRIMAFLLDNEDKFKFSKIGDYKVIYKRL